MVELSNNEQVVSIARANGFVRPADLDRLGIPRVNLQRLYKRGMLNRSGRGMYILSDQTPTETDALAEACRRVPQGVICLLSALRFHGIGTQNPFEVWMAIHFKARHPKVGYPPLRIVRFSGRYLTEGVEEHPTNLGSIRVYSPAKTVVDCFRYRNKIGLDVALEALREAKREKKATIDEIWRYAKQLRTSSVIRPYLESLSWPSPSRELLEKP
jgi:predicted transcriptional regulator of viral defense system